MRYFQWKQLSRCFGFLENDFYFFTGNYLKTNSNGLKPKVHPKLQGIIKTVFWIAPYKTFLNICLVLPNVFIVKRKIRWLGSQKSRLESQSTSKTIFLNSPNETFIILVISSGLLPLSLNAFIFISVKHIKWNNI